MNFTFNEHQVGGVSVLCPQGKLTGIGGRGALRQAIDRPFLNGYLKILLNLANVSEIDVSCMEVLSDIHVELNNKGVQIKIVNVSTQIMARMTAAERSVIDDGDHQFEAETLEASCAGCFFDCPYNGRSVTDQKSVSVKRGADGQSATLGVGLMMRRSRKKKQRLE